MSILPIPVDFNYSLAFKEALSNGQICLNYQPIIDLNTGRVQGYEALMRWTHPSFGSISPGIFIPALVESGLIVEASKWALRESCRALKRIEGRIGQVKNLYMSVNFTASDFAEESFLDDLYQIISASDVLPTQIQLEITEELLMSQPDNARKTLELCRKAGLKIAVDDFGTGKASLEFLQNFPIDTVKLDRVFIRGMTSHPEKLDEAKPVLSIAQKRHLTMTAEGIETQEEAFLLKQLGCNTAQGYYFAKPLPEKDITELLLGNSGFSRKLEPVFA
ncbi:MAG: hypothetical protein DI586_05825 [Micavibrio aeruginosavorus]|uniref:EAL domain-containing protein n=1 Tax=Micavibrio aeruginosavorus TaxID=349221 RepID=A0A2W5FPK8_9BACT|nr:MAG: hypothetical protein DI586_05825 [Micavibrio aeruginosavorus]